MTQVMISYRKIDGQKEFDYSLEKELAHAGLNTWIDINNIPPLSRWENVIFDGIRNSDFVVLCLSPEYFESEICLLECYVARAYGKKILPLIVSASETQGVTSSVYALCGNFEETRGIEHLNFLDFHWGTIIGLREDRDTMIERLVHAVVNPTVSDIDYDVFVSFKWQQAHFATQLADDLNKAGVRTFVHTRGIDVGADWRGVSWNASLKAKFHIVVLSPEIADSAYVSKEVLMSRTKRTAFIPVLPEEFVADEQGRSQIIRALASNRNLSELNDYQWLVPDKGYERLIENLAEQIHSQLGQKSKPE